MRILQIHNEYTLIGGEDTVLDLEKKLLQENNHEVFNYSVSNHSIKNIFDKIKIFINVHYSNKQKKIISKLLKKIKPDIVHVHNFFPLITPSVFDACKENNIPVVFTLHNYRLICPSGMLMYNDKIYEKSIYKGPYSTILDKVYKNSYFGTFALARMISYHKNKKTWENKVDQFIALTKFAKSKYIESGFNDKKFSIKPNFFISHSELINNKNRDGALYVGRLSKEKGIDILLKAWEKVPVKLKIVGNGPLSSMVAQSKNPNIEYLGFLELKEIYSLMQKSSFLVFPSIWYEGFPMVIIEALANGLPIIASNLGSMSEVIKNNVNGLHFDPGDVNDLIDKIKLLDSDKVKCATLSKNAYIDYKTNYTSEKNYKILIDIYQKCIESNV